MPQNAIQTIIETEKRAKEIVEAAAIRAQRTVEEAEETAKTCFTEIKAKKRAQADATVSGIRERASELQSISAQDAQGEAESIRAAAEIRMHYAIKEIIRGIMEECR